MAMKQVRERIEAFGLSFLDIISCGFGAVVLLILIFKFSPVNFDEEPKVSAQKLLDQLIYDETKLAENIKALQLEKERLNTVEKIQTSLSGSLKRAKETNQALVTGIREKTELLAMKRFVAQREEAKISDPVRAVAGIPVDRKYVVFVVDTSGSMKKIWREVTRKMDDVLKVHPKLLGFQVMNDNGQYILSGYAKSWISDTPSMRKTIIGRFAGWQAWSNSSPFEGLKTALVHYRRYQNDLAIYVFGDDYSGADFDEVINEISRLNRGKARIHAFNFISPAASTDRFSTLMRELAYRNDGAFLSL
jgi:hypothetical protein